MDYVYIFNGLETALWSMLSVLCLVRSCRRTDQRATLAMLSITFALFAWSELIEMKTGAWWRPRWLMLWKGGCITGLVILGYRFMTASPNSDSPNSDSAFRRKTKP